jgi:hypothetical protein
MENTPDLTTKRRVEVSVGCPDLLDGFPMERVPEMPHHTECYFLNFVDVADDDGGQNGFTAQTVCLCTLAPASVAWLQGASEEEVQALMGRHTGDDHDAG